MGSGNQEIGKRGEDAAAAYLERAGMSIIERNWRCSAGEIDIVAMEDNTLVLCEVKTRRTVAKGHPADAVTPARQRRYLRLAHEYLARTGHSDLQVRFDVITILVVSEDRALLRHLRAAFVPNGA